MTNVTYCRTVRKAFATIWGLDVHLVQIRHGDTRVTKRALNIAQPAIYRKGALLAKLDFSIPVRSVMPVAKTVWMVCVMGLMARVCPGV